jgi:aerobic-type carbon monoxide dehydrogenase small subunit (CoxS/CutS family)
MVPAEKLGQSPAATMRIFMMQSMELQINGSKQSVAAEPNARLLGVLRDQLGLTGSKYGCGEGSCGACTVLVDGRAVRSCVTLVEQCRGKQITTIEALEQDGKPHPLQQAFLDADALQCGYCTPGMIMSGAALLAGNARPTREQIVAAMEGNICRCGTYQRIIAAIQQAAGAKGDRA